MPLHLNESTVNCGDGKSCSAHISNPTEELIVITEVITMITTILGVVVLKSRMLVWMGLANTIRREGHLKHESIHKYTHTRSLNDIFPDGLCVFVSYL